MENKEKYIINQINNHRETVDTDALWDSLSASIPQKKEKKRRGVIWFWGGFLILGFTSLFGYMLIDNSDPHMSLKLIPVEEVDSQNTISPFASLAETEKSNNENLISEKKLNSNTQDENLSEFKSNRKSDKISLGQIEIIEKELNNNNDPLTSQMPVSLDYNIEKKELLSNSNVEQSLKNTARLNNRSGQRSFVEEISSRVNTLTNLIPLDFGKFDHQRPLLEMENEVYAKVDFLSEQSAKLNRWSVFINSGASYITRQLTTSDSESMDRRNRRSQIEKVVGGWDVSVGCAYQFGPSLSIASGLNIGQIHEQATYTTSYIVDSGIERITTTIHTQDGAVNSVIEDITLFSKRESNEIRNNTLTYFSIPIVLKYRLFENENYRLSLSGNAAYQFSQTYSGFTSLHESEPTYNLTSDTRYDFAKSGGLAFGFGMEAGKKISQNWEVSMGFGMKYMNGISSKTNPIDQKYKLYTLTFGLSRKI